MPVPGFFRVNISLSRSVPAFSGRTGAILLVNMTLVDSIKKKSDALRDIVIKLGLNGTYVVNARAEDIGNHPDFKRRFDYIVARSVSTLDNLVKRSKNLVKRGGKLITVKGMDTSEEVLRAKYYKYVKNIEVFENNGKNVLRVDFTVQ